MVFSSITFILYFFPVVLGGYYLLSFSRRLQNAWLLIASLFFYGWGEPVYVFVMIGSIIFNWVMGLLVDHYKDKKTWKKLFLIFACVLNLAVLGYFKYTNFIINNINSIFGEEVLHNIDRAVSETLKARISALFCFLLFSLPPYLGEIFFKNY